MKNEQLAKKAVQQKGCWVAKTKWQSEKAMIILQATLLLGSHLYAYQSICINTGIGAYWEVATSLARWQRTVFNCIGSTWHHTHGALSALDSLSFREMNCCVNLNALRTSAK